MGIGVVFIGLFTKAIAFAFYSYLYQFAVFDLNWTATTWLLLLFADDFTFYWHHRLSHTIRLLWSAHINHHSSQRYNLATALRQSWGESLYKFIWWFWLPLVGFPPLMILMMHAVSLIYQFFLHTQTVKKLGVLEYVMNTPSHHRVHHGTNLQYLDRNHGGIFIIWDRLFGTFQEEDERDPVVYGISTNIDTYNPLKIALHEFDALRKEVGQATHWKHKLGHVFMPPGWSPNGNQSMTTQARRKRELEKQS